MNDSTFIGGSSAGQIFLNPRYAKRHGLLAGAAGTGMPAPVEGCCYDRSVPVWAWPPRPSTYE